MKTPGRRYAKREADTSFQLFRASFFFSPLTVLPPGTSMDPMRAGAQNCSRPNAPRPAAASEAHPSRPAIAPSHQLNVSASITNSIESFLC